MCQCLYDRRRVKELEILRHLITQFFADPKFQVKMLSAKDFLLFEKIAHARAVEQIGEG